MKLLLHVCCAPCAIFSLSEARKDKFAVTGFFYNPNIQPGFEYAKRKKEAENYFKSEKSEFVSFKYDTSIFFKNIDGSENKLKRCQACWEMRLKKAVSFAKETGFDAFTTTLLASPYQEHDILKSICGNLSDNSGVNFYYKDFRVGFRDAHRLAREKGMYCQNYCGCVFSIVEREETRKKD